MNWTNTDMYMVDNDDLIAVITTNVNNDSNVSNNDSCKNNYNVITC